PSTTRTVRAVAVSRAHVRARVRTQHVDAAPRHRTLAEERPCELVVQHAVYGSAAGGHRASRVDPELQGAGCRSAVEGVRAFTARQCGGLHILPGAGELRRGRDVLCVHPEIPISTTSSATR